MNNKADEGDEPFKAADADGLSRDADIFTNFLRRLAAYLIDAWLTSMVTISGMFYMTGSGQSSIGYWVVMFAAS